MKKWDKIIKSKLDEREYQPSESSWNEVNKLLVEEGLLVLGDKQVRNRRRRIIFLLFFVGMVTLAGLYNWNSSIPGSGKYASGQKEPNVLTENEFSKSDMENIEDANLNNRNESITNSESDHAISNNSKSPFSTTEITVNPETNKPKKGGNQVHKSISQNANNESDFYIKSSLEQKYIGMDPPVVIEEETNHVTPFVSQNTIPESFAFVEPNSANIDFSHTIISLPYLENIVVFLPFFPRDLPALNAMPITFIEPRRIEKKNALGIRLGGITDGQMKGTELGLVFRHKRSPDWKVDVGLSYVWNYSQYYEPPIIEQATIYSFGSRSIDIQMKPTSLHFVTFPIHLTRNFRKFGIQAGTSLDYLIAMYGRIETIDAETGVMAEPPTFLNKRGVHSWTFKPSIALVYDFTQRVSLSFQASYRLPELTRASEIIPIGHRHAFALKLEYYVF